MKHPVYLLSIAALGVTSFRVAFNQNCGLWIYGPSNLYIIWKKQNKLEIVINDAIRWH